VLCCAVYGGGHGGGVQHSAQAPLFQTDVMIPAGQLLTFPFVEIVVQQASSSCSKMLPPEEEPPPPPAAKLAIKLSGKRFRHGKG